MTENEKQLSSSSEHSSAHLEVEDDSSSSSTTLSLTSNPYNGSKLFRYVMDYLNEIKNKPQDLVLECEEISLKVLDNDNGFKYVMRKMDGKEELEEAFFVEYLEKYCHEYHQFLFDPEQSSLNDVETSLSTTTEHIIEMQSSTLIEDVTEEETNLQHSNNSNSD
ncbi:hypothetical protein C9374_003473 [Naegleria lovaniensis]|uniref:Uncharacterized protein n=1 Tax=Naegleria lovaniensis TaxID=51637 RepID=A0AA88KKD7_NAELO|nr:uncharacterized protein C9374_003473 [Naegleria lovaniensis]KAG2385658.1 hypothetical protein C9374_003473 [Naegleria lovaniensis]